MKCIRATASSRWFTEWNSSDFRVVKNLGLLLLGLVISQGACERVLADSFEDSLKAAQVEQKPMLVVFGAQWCSWCRKLEAELAKTDAKTLQNQWIIAKVDVDEYPELGERYKVSALPALRVLRTDQSLVSGREGFVTIDKLQEWLEPLLLEADPKVQRVLYEEGQLADSDIEQLVKFLGDRSVSIRNAAEERMVKAKADTETAVVDLLRTGRLAQQLSAVEILKRWSAPISGIDPWDPETLSETRIAPLLEWLREQDALQTEVSDKDATAESRPFTEEEMVAAVTKLIRAETTTIDEAMAAVVKMGTSVLADLRLRLSDTEGLSDEERERLREALYLILSGAKTRLERNSLLKALAKLDAETHREAAIELMKHVNSQDQPIVDELSLDGDPLVREAAVGQLERIGAMKDPTRLKRLLADPSPSVRTAALRTVSENPRAPLVDTLIEYLGTESDEDLLVYATKTLGQLKSTENAEDALLDLATNQAWRVRAAALDAIKEKLDKNRSNFTFQGSGLGRENKVSERLANAVVERAKDEDDFVAEKASQLLPRILTAESADKVANYLLEFPGKINTLGADLSEYERDEVIKPLAKFVADKWITDEDPKKVRIAAEILEKFDRSQLKDQIKVLLGSSDYVTRIIGARVFVSLVHGERDDKLTSYEGMNVGSLSRSRNEKRASNPWHRAPESFQNIPMGRRVPIDGAEEPDADIVASSEDSLFQQPIFDSRNNSEEANSSLDAAALDAFDDLFGSLAEDAQAEPEGDLDDTSINEANDSSASIAVNDKPEQEEAETSELDDALDLFGDLVEVPKPNLPQIQSSRDAVQRQSEETINSRSSWLTMWQKSDAKRPRWMDGCQEIILARCKELSEKHRAGNLQQEGKKELLWMLMAKLACGAIDETQLLIDSIATLQSQPMQSATGDEISTPDLYDAWPWLPASVRSELIGELKLDWSENAFEKHKSQLERLTDIDHLEMADWLFRGFETHREKHDLDVAVASRLLKRALQGNVPSDSDWYFYESALMASETAFKNIQNELARTSEFKNAVKWLDDQYTIATDLQLRAVLLVVLQYYEHDRACESAVGIICEAEEESALLDTALAIALSDYTAASADRAVQFLGHSLQKVRRAAISRLLSSGQVEHYRNSGVRLYYDYDEIMPAYWLVNRSFPATHWGKILAEAEVETKRNAVLLASALGGKEFNLDDTAEVSGISSQDMALAFAKAGRNDDEAIAVYRKAMESTEQPKILYRALRVVAGDQVRQLRSEMREKHGSSVLE